MKTRIIAKLDVKPPNVVKPIHFEGLRVMGSPKELAENYYTQGADEIFYLDIVASLYRREILYNEIRRAARDVFVPLAVGGGISSVEDCAKLFDAGANKVVINTHAVSRSPRIIDSGAAKFGSQAIVVNIEAKKIGRGWECYTDCGRIPSGREVMQWAREVEARGAGEILLQSVDADGLQRGFDLELASQVVDAVNIPVVVSSGAGSISDIETLIERVSPSGVAVASILHYETSTIDDIRSCVKKTSYEAKR